MYSDIILIRKQKTKRKSSSLEEVKDSQLGELIEKYGTRYVIRNYKLSDTSIAEIVSNKYSSISEEDDIDYHEILEYQKTLK